MTTNNTLQQQQRKRFHPKYSSPQSLFPSSGGTPTTFSDSHRSSSSSVAAVSTFKENLRRECLSKARLKRQERFLRARTKTSTAVNPYINNNNNSSSSQFQQQQDNEDCNVLARQLVQDEIRACRIEVVAHPSSSSRHLECVGPSPPLSASSSSSSSAAVHIYTTPDERHHPTTKYCTLSEEGGGERLVFNGEGDHSTPPHCSVTESSSNNPRFYFGDTFNKTSSSITEIMTNKTLQEQEYTKKDNNNNNNHLMNPYNYQTPPSSQLQFIPNGNCEHEHYDNDCIVITEEEAYDIMKEVEEELRREGKAEHLLLLILLVL